MKFLANRQVDQPDLKRLWLACHFESAEAAVALFYESYPHDEFDPELVGYLKGVVGIEDVS